VCQLHAGKQDDQAECSPLDDIEWRDRLKRLGLVAAWFVHQDHDVAGTNFRDKVAKCRLFVQAEFQGHWVESQVAKIIIQKL